ncbi:MAG: aspartate--tRNA ligase [Bacillota bacterium]|nr:aspartate--tRNA ligase [Candidatus Fermentithermobacillaceae bacterium]
MSGYEGQKRTCYCGELNEKDAGSRVVLMGWVNRQRDLGELIFIDLRDRTGMVQVVTDHNRSPESFRIAKKVRSEYVLCVSGTVVRRAPGTENPGSPTGMIEVMADDIKVFNRAKTPPFVIRDEAEPDEGLRMRYRYLDLRRLPMLRNLELRHKATLAIRNYLSQNGFWEVETPTMTKSTPEGARDYLVPSRLDPGRFFALAQSPQLFKQLLMVSGVDKYFQLARCYRDEDLRADRQPEFTQIDIEVSFSDEDQLFAVIEGMMKHLWKEVLDVEIDLPFPRMTWNEAMERYGSDKPDTRFGMEIHDITGLVQESGFMVFRNTVESQGTVRALCAPGCAGMSRQELDSLVAQAKEFGAAGLIHLAYLPGGEVKSPVRKHLSDEEVAGIASVTGAREGDLVLIVAGPFEVAVTALGRIRLSLGDKLGLIPEGKYKFLWITEFPLLEKNEEDSRWQAAHHPFTSPVARHAHLLESEDESDKALIRARAYDLVLNGVELASGSVRIHERELQDKMFRLLDLSVEQAEEKFGFLLEAFEYGAPPHCGIAFGLDRLVMLMAGVGSIREVIAFPKTTKATCLLTGAPSQVSPEQLEELGLLRKADKQQKTCK